MNAPPVSAYPRPALDGDEGAGAETLIGGRFRLEERIGSGGMSTVHRAFDRRLGRSVAIKRMHLDDRSNLVRIERFRREARVMAQLNHPHVVGVLDTGEHFGAPYIVLEYVEGGTLKDRIRRVGRLAVTEAASYAIEIGHGLSCAHAHRLVHRDVKTRNVLLGPDGRAEANRLRDRPSARWGGPDRDRRTAWEHRLRLARAGTGSARDRAFGHLLPRGLSVRDARRRDPLPG
jgi:eukaryotic-like serine/threonine-protein kinase